MRNIIVYAIFITIIFPVFLCSCEKTQLEKALDYSGDNRGELETVLKYFSENTKDSLHLRAAIFLIENMPGHYSHTNEELETYFSSINTNYPKIKYHEKMALFCLPQFFSYQDKEDSLEDIRNIKANFLIKHIEKSVDNYLAAPWCEDLSFDYFCKYILPYRMDNEPLEEIENSIKYLNLDSILEPLRMYNTTSYELNDFLKSKKLPSNSVIFTKVFSRGPESTGLECIESSYRELARNRSISIPTAMDYVPHWADRNGRHYWTKVVDGCFKMNISTQFSLSETKIAKVYRKTYYHNKYPLSNGNDYIPFLFCTPFNEDVTDEYIKTADIVISPQINKGHNPKHFYLSVFNELEWKEVAWAELDRGKTTFRNMGVGNIYLPGYYVKDRFISADFPFLLNRSGNIKRYIPDIKETISLTLNRKYPMTQNKLSRSAWFKGAMVIASNDYSFTQQDTLAIVESERYDSKYTIEINSKEKYRYFKILKPGPCFLTQVQS